MTPLELVKSVLDRDLIDPEGEPCRLELMPGVPDAEVNDLSKKLGVELAEDIRDLLKFTRGFDFHAYVEFSGCQMHPESDFFERFIDIAADGFGNFWVLDLTNCSDQPPIYFQCHDAPVLLYQSKSLSEFLEALFQMCRDSRGNPIDDVHEDRIFDVWRKNPGLIDQPLALTHVDQQIRAFASELDERWLIKDLRDPKVGDGISWGRFGPETEFRRFGEQPIFAIRKPEPGFFGRLFGKR